SGVRGVRQSKNIGPREPLTLEVVASADEKVITKCPAIGPIIKKMAGLEGISYVEQKGEGSSAFMIGTREYAVPLGNLIDVEAELEKAEAQLKHLQGFLMGVRKKLSNERFVANAPEAVVALERKKESDSLEKIAALEQTIAELKKNS
ncbi:MAG: valine--tRNA ligase, partial [Prevotella sp.]|nr:valine--tRNA ligase [Prevotella sp.]